MACKCTVILIQIHCKLNHGVHIFARTHQFIYIVHCVPGKDTARWCRGGRGINHDGQIKPCPRDPTEANSGDLRQKICRETYSKIVPFLQVR